MLTADEVRSLGDASAEQRQELRALLQARAVNPAWKQRFYTKVRNAEGLARLTAVDALIYLRSLAPAGQQPTRAIPAQADAMRHLRRTRIVPIRTAHRMLKICAEGKLTYDRADLIIQEWLRLPYRDHPFLEDGTTLNPNAPDGYFGLTAADGMPRCYRVHTRPGSGTRIVQQILGDRPSQRREITGDRAQLVMHQIAADVPAAARLYGQTRQHCSNCNQPLSDTTQPGYPNGYGRDCWDARQAGAEPELASAEKGS